MYLVSVCDVVQYMNLCESLHLSSDDVTAIFSSESFPARSQIACTFKCSTSAEFYDVDQKRCRCRSKCFLSYTEGGGTNLVKKCYREKGK